jgi:lipoprotein-releasing system permease protein
MNFPLYVAKRYLSSNTKNTAINIINRIAAVGIVVGVAVLFFVLSVFSGLIDFSLSFSNSIDPDLKVQTTVGKSFTISDNQLSKIKKIEDISCFSKIVEERVLFSFGDKNQVTYLKGVDSAYTKVSPIRDKVYEKQWFSPNSLEVIVGAGVAEKLGLGLFDANSILEVFVPKPGEGTIENPDDAFNNTQLLPIGLYSIADDYDFKYVFCDINLAQALLSYKQNQISSLEIKLKPNTSEAQTIVDLQDILGKNIIVKNKIQQNDTLYKMLNTENIALYLIFTLVIIIALFNLVGALIMMIIDKQSNLKTMHALGVEIKNLRKIFLFQGTLLCFFGGLLGLTIGIILVLFQQQFGFLMVTADMAYPVKFVFKNVFVVLLTIIPLGFLASFIASSRINKKLFR